MFGFIRKVFFTVMTFFSFNGIAFHLLNLNSLECVSVNNQECKIRKKNSKYRQ